MIEITVNQIPIHYLRELVAMMIMAGVRQIHGDPYQGFPAVGEVGNYICHWSASSTIRIARMISEAT